MADLTDVRGDQRLQLRRWWVLVVVLLLVGAGCLAVGLRTHQRRLAGPAMPSSVPLTAVGDGAATAPVRVGQVLERSAPVALRIPAIGVKVSVSTLGLNPDGTVQVPTNFQEPGWFRLGPAPGQLGSAVILGHVDSYQGPAVFFRLRSLRVGDGVEVTLADGAVAHFVVTSIVTYAKQQFPAIQVYGPHGYSGLQLVTCGGTFDSRTHSYLSNVVAYTRLVSAAPAA